MGQIKGRLASLAVGTLLLVACCSTGSSEPFVSIGSCDASRPAAGVARLDVDAPIGSVDVAPSPDDTVTVTAKISVRESLRAQFPAADATRDLKIEVVGDALRIGSGHADDGHRNDFQIDLVVRAPARSAWRAAPRSRSSRASSPAGASRAPRRASGLSSTRTKRSAAS